MLYGLGYGAHLGIQLHRLTRISHVVGKRNDESVQKGIDADESIFAIHSKDGPYERYPQLLTIKGIQEQDQISLSILQQQLLDGIERDAAERAS